MVHSYSQSESVFSYVYTEEDSHLQLQQIQGENPTYHPSQNSRERFQATDMPFKAT